VSRENKKMTVMQLTILTATNMIGAGIIMLPTQLAKVGTMSILSWLITASGALALAYAFSKCGMYSKKTGGMGGYAEYAFGKMGNFLANYTYGVSLLIANVAIAIMAIGYIAQYVNISLSPIEVSVGTILILWLATVMNFGGAKNTGQINSITILGVVLPVAFVAIFGWFWFSTDIYVSAWNPNNFPVFEGVGMSISMTLWSFLGLESACANTEAVENPERNVPIAVFGGTIVAAIIYILSTNVIAGIVPNEALLASTGPFGLVFSQMLGGFAGKVVVLMMIVACFGSLLGWQFTIAQVFKSAADVGYFPKLFSKTTLSEVPIKGMLIITGLQSILALMTISPSLTKQFSVLVDLSVVTNIYPYILSMVGLIAIQKSININNAKVRTNNFIAILATIYSFYALYSIGYELNVYGFIVTTFGWSIFCFNTYKVSSRSKSKA
jgi:putrescine:ornithine antiporter